MTRRNTKETILYEALKLFSDKGYDGVSVRDIAGQVGIKQSSLYKHYTNKQDIFDSLVKTMQTHFMDSAICPLPCGELKEIAREYATAGNEILKKISAEIFHFYLKDPYASQYRKLLSIEKYKNKEIERIYREVYIDSAISYQAALFDEMIRQGFMRQADPRIMAIQFFSPIFLLLNKYESIPEKENEAVEILEKHIEQFDRVYRKESDL